MADKGVIVEFDFAVANGAELLFECAKAQLEKSEIAELDAPMESRYLTGKDCQEGLAALFAAVKTKKTAQKAARDIDAAFRAALNDAVPKAVGLGFRNFVKTLADKGVKVIISTRADVETVRPAFAQILGDNVTLYQDLSQGYGVTRWDVWRRACAENKVHHVSVVAVAGSGYSAKTALYAGLGTIAVVNDHVAYQDFTGADDVVNDLSTAVAKRLLQIMRIA